MNVKVKGLSELAKFMHELPEKVEKNVMRGALRAGAKVLEAEVIKNVPVEMGDLKASIKVSTRNKRGEITASVKSERFYARMVEFGTAAHWITIRETSKPTKITRSGLQTVSTRSINKMQKTGALKIGTHFVGASVAHPGAKPTPFMRPALDSKSAEALIAAGNYIKARLQKKHGLDTSGVSVEAEEQ